MVLVATFIVQPCVSHSISFKVDRSETFHAARGGKPRETRQGNLLDYSSSLLDCSSFNVDHYSTSMYEQTFPGKRKPGETASRNIITVDY